MNILPNEQLNSYLKDGNPTYTGLIRCLQNRDQQQTYTPKGASSSFTDRQFTHVEQTPSKHQKKQERLQKIIQSFQQNGMSADQFKKQLIEQEIEITPQIEKIVRDQSKVGVSNKDMIKVIFQQIREETIPKNNPNYQDPSAYAQFNVYDMRLKDIDESKKLYCETHILVHGTTGAIVGKRADVLTKFYTGTKDLLDWEKENSIDEVVNQKKGPGLHQKSKVVSDIFAFNQDQNENSESMQQKRKARIEKRQDNGNIINWTNSNEPEELSSEQYFNSKKYSYLKR